MNPDHCGFTASQLFVEWGIGNTVYSSADDGEYPYKEIIIDQLATSGTTTVRIGFRNDAAYFDMDDVTVRAVPEPVSAALLGLGLIGLGFMRRNVKP